MNTDSLRNAYVTAYQAYSREIDKTYQLLVVATCGDEDLLSLQCECERQAFERYYEARLNFLEAIQSA